MKREMKEKTAGELSDHDVIEHHGMVDWTTRAPKPLQDHIMVHVHSQSPRGSYTLLLPQQRKVRYWR